MKQKLLYEGKAKLVYETEDPNVYRITYKDDVTAGNGEKKETISGKGKLSCAISNSAFQMLSKNGIPTHFIKAVDELSVLVKRVSIIPLEVIVRNVAAGSFSKKYGVEEGSALRSTVLELCYKDDSLGDPMINESQALALGLATEQELKTIATLAASINGLLTGFFRSAGLRLVDFKLEFGKVGDELILADEISPDTCRLWDMATNEKLDKDLFRRDLGDIITAYQEVLKRVAQA